MLIVIFILICGQLSMLLSQAHHARNAWGCLDSFNLTISINLLSLIVGRILKSHGIGVFVFKTNYFMSVHSLHQALFHGELLGFASMHVHTIGKVEFVLNFSICGIRQMKLHLLLQKHQTQSAGSVPKEKSGGFCFPGCLKW